MDEDEDPKLPVEDRAEPGSDDPVDWANFSILVTMCFPYVYLGRW